MNDTKHALTMIQLAERLQIGKSTLYGVLARLEDENPETVFYMKIGNMRRFTEEHYNRIVAALEDRPRGNSAPYESERAKAHQLSRAQIKRNIDKLRRERRQERQRDK